jgi:hypothetical protein
LCGTDITNIGIGSFAYLIGAGTKYFALGEQLNVDLNTDVKFVMWIIIQNGWCF